MNSLNIISMSYFEDFDILFQPMPYHDHANPLPYTDRSKNHITGDKLFKRKKKISIHCTILYAKRPCHSTVLTYHLHLTT